MISIRNFRTLNKPGFRPFRSIRIFSGFARTFGDAIQSLSLGFQQVIDLLNELGQLLGILLDRRLRT